MTELFRESLRVGVWTADLTIKRIGETLTVRTPYVRWINHSEGTLDFGSDSFAVSSPRGRALMSVMRRYKEGLPDQYGDRTDRPEVVQEAIEGGRR